MAVGLLAGLATGGVLIDIFFKESIDTRGYRAQAPNVREIGQDTPEVLVQVRVEGKKQACEIPG
jgi:hypothetical protein